MASSILFCRCQVSSHLMHAFDGYSVYLIFLSSCLIQWETSRLRLDDSCSASLVFLSGRFRLSSFPLCTSVFSPIAFFPLFPPYDFGSVRSFSLCSTSFCPSRAVCSPLFALSSRVFASASDFLALPSPAVVTTHPHSPRLRCGIGTLKWWWISAWNCRPNYFYSNCICLLLFFSHHPTPIFNVITRFVWVHKLTSLNPFYVSCVPTLTKLTLRMLCKTQKSSFTGSSFHIPTVISDFSQLQVEEMEGKKVILFYLQHVPLLCWFMAYYFWLYVSKCPIF